MAGLGDLVQLFGPPPVRDPSSDDWAEVEGYVGSALPGDFKAFLDAYGTGAICGELVVFHPKGSGRRVAAMLPQPTGIVDAAECTELLGRVHEWH
ncbi:SMI1/KNR4 family protein [Streptomyces sp. NBC_00365]|uniref:hypothetical protein n=1 Tax=Streptomyces sp. NBC_00365 TaxID=2975726 RepID=UPI00225BBD9C|nr:hypothetical protein [Streptomyces sp. NBC_00365]MCX5087532.1 SMI1/KNR4 family protein [Streptomyces sp. NBC_00365]